MFVDILEPNLSLKVSKHLKLLIYYAELLECHLELYKSSGTDSCQ